MPRVHHAVRAARIAALRAVLLPLRRLQAVPRKCPRSRPAAGSTASASRRSRTSASPTVCTRSFRLPIRNSEKQRVRIKLPLLLSVRQDRAKHPSRLRLARGKWFWSGALSYVYPGETIMLSTPAAIISSKCARTLFGSAPSKSVVFVVTRKPAATAAFGHPPSQCRTHPRGTQRNHDAPADRPHEPRTKDTCLA